MQLVETELDTSPCRADQAVQQGPRLLPSCRGLELQPSCAAELARLFSRGLAAWPLGTT